MASPFRSFTNAKPVNGAVKNWSEAEVMAIARQLLTEHKAARDAAIEAENLVCGNCAGAGTTPSTLMPGETVPCIACDGTGKPNDKVQSIPPMTEEDMLRMWKLGQLVKGPYGRSIVPIIREFYPEMYPAAGEERPN